MDRRDGGGDYFLSHEQIDEPRHLASHLVPAFLSPLLSAQDTCAKWLSIFPGRMKDEYNRGRGIFAPSQQSSDSHCLSPATAVSQCEILMRMVVVLVYIYLVGE